MRKIRDSLAQLVGKAREPWVFFSALAATGLHKRIGIHDLAALARRWRELPRGPSAILSAHAVTFPDKDALIDGELRLSYRMLDENVNRLANGLIAAGVNTGDRVAIMMRNCAAYLISQWAVTRIGALTVQVGYRLKAQEVAHILTNSEPRIVLYQSDYGEVIFEAKQTAGSPVVTVRAPDELDRLITNSSPFPPRIDPKAKGGVIIYTSGTTGKPKGAARDFEKTIHVAVADLMRQTRIRHEDIHLVVCPLYHSAAPAFMALTYMVGGTVVLLDHFDAELVLKTIAKERVTSAFLVPTMLGRLAALPEATRRLYDTSSLRWIISGAAPLPTDTARRFEEAFGSVLFNFYGATETGMVTLACPGEHTVRPGTIGRMLAGNSIRLLGENRSEVAPGEVGELFARSSMLVAGYHKNREATREAMNAGYFSVGDLARKDRDGYYYLADRKHDMIISGGMNIYPLEVEELLHSHPDVLECAVVGVPDADWGESVKAFVVPRSTISVDALREYCKRHLAGYKCPKHVELIDALPRTPTGKVLRRELRNRTPSRER